MSKKQMELFQKQETVDVATNLTVSLWLKEKAKRDPAAFARLVQDNRERLGRILGEQSGVVTEGKKKVSVWTMEEAGSQVFITSSQEGTVFKIFYPGGERAYVADRRMGSAMTSFLERFLQDLSGFGPIRTF